MRVHSSEQNTNDDRDLVRKRVEALIKTPDCLKPVKMPRPAIVPMAFLFYFNICLIFSVDKVKFCFCRGGPDIHLLFE